MVVVGNSSKIQFQLLRQQEDGTLIKKYGGLGIPYKVRIQSDNGTLCIRIHWGTELAHNSPISAVLPTIHNCCDRTVVMRAFDFAHARTHGISKIFFIKFLNNVDAQRFICLYTFFAPEPEEKGVMNKNAYKEVDQEAMGNGAKGKEGNEPKGAENGAEELLDDATFEACFKDEDEDEYKLTAAKSSGSDSDEDSSRGKQDKPDIWYEEEEEEHHFQCTQDDNWAQKPIWGSNAY